MMKFRYYICFLVPVLLSCTEAAARQDRAPDFLDTFTFGVEGNYANSVVSYRHYNFVSSYGYRIDRKYWDSGYHVNGEFLIHVGMNVDNRLNLSLYTGYSGIFKNMRTTPLTLRVTYCFGKDRTKNRWLVYADAGPGITQHSDKVSISGICKAGTGYRIPLSRYTRLDFLMSVRAAMTSTGAFEMNTGSSIYIPEENLRRNDAFYFALMFGIGITF